MNTQQKRTISVLEAMIQQVKDDADTAEVFADILDPALDSLVENDFFGSEQECDPRGDFRNGEWSMYEVEAIDG